VNQYLYGFLYATISILFPSSHLEYFTEISQFSDSTTVYMEGVVYNLFPISIVL